MSACLPSLQLKKATFVNLEAMEFTEKFKRETSLVFLLNSSYYNYVIRIRQNCCPLVGT